MSASETMFGEASNAHSFLLGVNQSAGLKKGLATNKQVNTDDHKPRRISIR